jgi:hypothetical protein
MIRIILGIFVGYAFFVFTSLLFFNLSGQNPHGDPTIGFTLLTALYGAATSFISGLLACWIANRKDLRTNYILAGIIAGFAAFSLFKSEGNHWTQIIAIFIFAPVSILGGWLLMKKSKKA